MSICGKVQKKKELKTYEYPLVLLTDYFIVRLGSCVVTLVIGLVAHIYGLFFANDFAQIGHCES